MRKLFLIGFSILTFLQTNAQAKETYVIVHGAWGGAWDWKKVDSLLTAQGHKVYRVTLTGLGERYHLANKSIGLYTHINDVINTILFENLQEVLLVGHSYGGMVITGVSDSIATRIKRRIYIDALLPQNGESATSLVQVAICERLKKAAASSNADGLIVPAWVQANAPFPKDVPHPAKTFLDTLWLKHEASTTIPSTYIFTVDKGKKPEEDEFYFYAERAKKMGFTFYQMDNTSHTPERSKPNELAVLMLLTKE